MKKTLNHVAEYKWVLIFALVVALLAGVFNWWGAGKYNASLVLTVSRLGTQNAADYKYDNYYALKASDEFGSVVEGWFKTPEMTQLAYKEAGLSLGAQSLGSLSRHFTVAKISPATVEVRFSAANIGEVEAIGAAIVKVAAQKAATLNAASNQGVSFSITGGEPVAVDNSINFWRNILVGFLAGLIFGVFIKVAGGYFKEN